MKMRHFHSSGWAFVIWLFSILITLGLATLAVHLRTVPLETLFLCFSTAVAGAIAVIAADWPATRRDSALSRQREGTRKRLWRVGWLLLIVGACSTLFCVGLLIRH